MALEAAEQIANMMVLDPYPGFDGKYFSMPCRNVLPKPVQKPHPPMWMACTNRDTIQVAARIGLGALAFSFVDPDEARTWADIYYDIIKIEECVPLGHTVNANIAMVVGFLAPPRPRRGDPPRSGGLRVLRLRAQRAGRPRHRAGAHQPVGRVPGDPRRTAPRSWSRHRPATRSMPPASARPTTCARHLLGLQEAGVDQVIFLQQAGRNRHADICESLELFAAEVLPAFKADVAARERRKAAELAPSIAAALARKTWMQPLADHEIPVVKAAVARAQVPAGVTVAAGS